MLGQIHIERGEADLALPLLVEARAVYAAASDPALELAAADNLLGELHSQAGRYDIAEGHYADAIACLRARATANDPRLAELLDNLAVTRGRAGKLADAEALHSEALAIFRAARGEQHPHTAHALFNLANVREMRDDFAGADGAFRQAEAIQRAALGDTHPNLAQTLASHTFMLNRAGRHAEAVQRGREAVAAASALTPPNPISAYAHAMYGESLLIDGQPAVAVAELRDALSQRERMLPDDHPVRLNSESLLGAALAASGDTDEGQRRLRHALERLLATLGPEHEFTRRAQARVERYSPRSLPSKAFAPCKVREIFMAERRGCGDHVGTQARVRGTQRRMRPRDVARVDSAVKAIRGHQVRRRRKAARHPQQRQVDADHQVRAQQFGMDGLSDTAGRTGQ